MGMCRAVCALCAVVWYELSYFPTPSFRDDEGDVHKNGYDVCFDVTNLEHREMNELKSIVEAIDWLDERFVLKREGEEGYGENVSVDAVRR